MGQPTTTKQHLESVHLQVAWLTSKIDGAGLIQIPKAYVARELAAKTLIGVLGDCVQPKVDRFFVYYSSRRQMRPALKALIDFLRDAYRRAPAAERPGLQTRGGRPA